MQNNQPDDTVRAYIITVISLILGLLFDYFFYDKMPGISFPLYVFLIIAGLFLIAGFLNKRFQKIKTTPGNFILMKVRRKR